jgi:predicted dehydrogenase
MASNSPVIASGDAPVRIAVAGVGVIGRRHVELIQASGACTLAAVVDPAPTGVELAQRAGVPCFGTLAQMLERDRPDGIILATPNHLHVEQALQCLDAGVAVLVEKPLAHTVEEAQRLCRAVENLGGRLLVGHHRAHSPILARARDIVQQGLLGALVAVSGSALFFKPDGYFSAAPWRTRRGGGPVLINLIHEVGNLRSLCGEIVEVQATTSNTRRGFEVEDTAAVLLCFACGALGTFLLSDTAASSRSWEQTSRENPDYASDAEEDCYFLSGTQGTLSMPTMRLKRFGQPQERSWFTPMERSVVELQREDPLALQLVHFCRVVRGETSPLVSARDGLQNLRVVEAVMQAASTGQRVRVGL